MSQVPSDQESQEVFVRFVDILFAVVLGQSFVVLNSVFRDPKTDALRLGTIFLIYALVISSWYGYHRSVRIVHIKSTFRWLVDVMLLFVYYAGFVAASDLDPSKLEFTPILLVFVVTFTLYSAWDAVRIREYWSQPELKEFHLYKRFGESIIFTVVLAVVTLLYVYFLKPNGVEWGYLVGLIGLLILYRFLKLYKKA